MTKVATRTASEMNREEQKVRLTPTFETHIKYLPSTKCTHSSDRQLHNSLKVPHIIDPPARRGHLHSGGFLRVLLLGGDALEVGTGNLVPLVLRLSGTEELRPAVPAEERVGVGIVGGEEVGVHGSCGEMSSLTSY